MSSIRYEWVVAGVGTRGNVAEAQLIRSVDSSAKLAVTTTATTAGSRPVAPASALALFARVTAIDANIIVAWGADPTASQTNGLLVITGATELIPVSPGDKLSFVELT